MSRRNMDLVRRLLDSVALEEIVLSQVKRQIDDGMADGKPMLPLWADRVAFQVGPRGGTSIVADQYSRRRRQPLTRMNKPKKLLAKRIRQLKRVTGTMRTHARVVLKKLSKIGARTKTRTKRGTTRVKKATDPCSFRAGQRFHSYRRGGRPLLDTRRGYAALHAVAKGAHPRYEVAIRAPLYMVYQHHGFSTTGPNFIPISRKAARVHQKGADPKKEGLCKGKDYWIMRQGVTVPARPFAKLGPSYMRRVARSIALGMRAHG